MQVNHRYTYTFTFGSQTVTLDRAVELPQRSFLHAVRQQAAKLGLTPSDLTDWEVRRDAA